MVTERLNERSAYYGGGLDAQLSLRMALRLRARGLGTDHIAAPGALLSLTAFGSADFREGTFAGKSAPKYAGNTTVPAVDR